VDECEPFFNGFFIERISFNEGKKILVFYLTKQPFIFTLFILNLCDLFIGLKLSSCF